MSLGRAAVVTFLGLFAAMAFSLRAGQVQDRSADKDYGAELPRIPSRTPVEALGSFQTRPGFHIELVAAEPLVRSPVALDFDENGRLFVVEFPEYNQNFNKAFTRHGCVRMLQDTQGAGTYDRSTIYVDGLDSPVAIACYDGGIFVGAVPNIWYFKDSKRDGKVDVRKPIYTGFNRDPSGEAMLNSLHWGLDNRFHLSTSLSGGNVRRADDRDARPVSVRGMGFLFDPRSGTFDVTSGGGQHGMSLDDWGRTFVCDNSNPVNLLMYDRRYIARNPYLQPPSPSVNIAPGGKYTKLYRISPVEPWRKLRTRLRTQGVVPGSDEGGQPSGFFTGATGVTVYRGDAWPAEYRGNVLVGEVSGNLVYRARLEPDGVGLKALRADRDVEFLASTDNWFRPVQFYNGPDGCLYVIDMYREVIETIFSLPPQILKHLDVASGIDKGRIYRIVPEGFKRPPPPKLGSATTAQLVALLDHPNGWHRDTASRLLYERQDRDAVASLRKLTSSSKSPLGRVHALYALNGLHMLDSALVLHALSDREPRVREHALRLAERFAGTDPQLLARVVTMTDDPDLRVRYQLAFSLGEFKDESATRALVRLVRRDHKQPWFHLAILSSAGDRLGDLFGFLFAEKDLRAARKDLLIELAEEIGGASRPRDVARVLQAIDTLQDADKDYRDKLVLALLDKQSATARERWVKHNATLKRFLDYLLRDARAVAVDFHKTDQARAAAVRLLRLGPLADTRGVYRQLLQADQPQPVAAAALEVLGSSDQAEVAKLVLEAWPSLTPALRKSAAETLFSRTAWVAAFLNAVEQKRVALVDLDPARARLLQAYPDEKLRQQAQKLFASATLPRRQDVVDDYQKALGLRGDAARGKAIFKKACSACHNLEGVGLAVGPDLAATRDWGPEKTLLNILDPNREVQPQYLVFVLMTKSGRILTGMVTNETANGVTIRRVDQTSETVPRADIDELRSTGQSFMPEGLEKELNYQAMADLLAYLRNAK
jgi:putative membrane-bound dehydrogenase-like protein